MQIICYAKPLKLVLKPASASNNFKLADELSRAKPGAVDDPAAGRRAGQGNLTLGDLDPNVMTRVGRDGIQTLVCVLSPFKFKTSAIWLSLDCIFALSSHTGSSAGCRGGGKAKGGARRGEGAAGDVSVWLFQTYA